MTDEELNTRFAQMADAVGRVANASSQGLEGLEERMEAGFQRVEKRMEAGFQRVERAQLRFQEQLGDLAGIMRQVIDRQDRHEQEMAEIRQEQAEFRQQMAEFRQRQEEFRQRQEESDERFNILLQEIRFLIRQQQQPPQAENEH